MEDAGEAPGESRSDAAASRFDTVTIALHWTTLLLVVGLFATAWMRVAVEGGEASALLLATHRSIGTALWAITLARLLWRRTAATVPPLPQALPRAQRLAARATEAALYLLLVLQPLTGFAHSLLRGKPFDLLLVTVPALTARHRRLSHALLNLHESGAWLLLMLIALHAAAACFHHLVLGDGVLRSILPRRRRPAEASGEILFEAGE
jgi:cytochrome b561